MGVPRRAKGLALAVVLAAGCGGSESAPRPANAPSGDGGADAGLDIQPPAAPELTSWTCPRGWVPETVLEDTELAYSICAPPPLPEGCPSGTMPVVGETDCQPIGDPCPAGDWPVGLPASVSVVYVKSGAAGGDGSSTSSPLATIGEAVIAAGDGAMVAIAKGTYAEAITVDKSLTLWGACVTEVTIDGPVGGLMDGTVDLLAAATVTMRNVTVTGPRVGILAAGDATLQATGVRIDGAAGMGVRAIGGTLDFEDVAITGTQAIGDGTHGRGLVVQSAVVTVRRALLEANRVAGVLADGGGAELTLTDVVVKGTLSQESDQSRGRGLGAQNGAHVAIERALLEGNREVGLYAGDRGTDITLTDVVVRDTLSQGSDQDLGLGLSVQAGARVTAQRALFERNRYIGVNATNDSPEIELTDVVVRDTLSHESDLEGGDGLVVEAATRATVSRALFDHNRSAGVLANQVGTDVTLTDVVVHDTLSQESDQVMGRGLTARGGARVFAQRMWIHQNREVGVVIAEAGTDVTLTDLVVSDTQSDDVDTFQGRGLAVALGAHATVERALFERNREMGIVAMSSGTTLRLEDVVVKDMLPREADGEYGVGVAVTIQAAMDLTRCRISDSRVAGILSMDASFLTVTSTQVTATHAGSLTLTGPSGHVFDGPHYDDVGDGVLVVDNSQATLVDVRVTQSARAGLLFSNSAGTLSAVTSSGSRYGLALQGTPRPSYDAGCDFGGNSEVPILSDGNLPVPDAPLDVPQAP